MKGRSDMGFGDFLNTVDCMVMGRKCMEMISSMNLTPAQWPYDDLPITVLSNTLKMPPENLVDKVEMFSGELSDLVTRLEDKGLKHAYVDGGSTITSFINQNLIDEMTITHAPILLGEGLPLFGKLNSHVKLVQAKAEAFPNNFVQIHYTVKYLE